MEFTTTKPRTTWQVYYPNVNKLEVHESDDPNSRIVFFGDPADYSGFATEPEAPTSEYIEKHKK